MTQEIETTLRRGRYLILRSQTTVIAQNIIVPILKDERVLFKAAKDLGIAMQDGGIALKSDEEFPVLMDYLIYCTYTNGLNFLEAALHSNTPPLNPKDQQLLKTMCDAKYGLCSVMRVIPEFGVEVLDEWRNEQFVLADLGFAASIKPGKSVVGHYLRFPEFGMTTGSMLPFTSAAMHQTVKDMAATWFSKCGASSIHDLNSEHRSELIRRITAYLLGQDVTQNMQIIDAVPRPRISHAPSPRPPRNRAKQSLKKKRWKR